MAIIRYKDTDGRWVQLSASDIGAASDSLIARGVGQPIASDTNTHIQNDTVLYIDQNEYEGDKTTITRLSTQTLELPVPIDQGGTGAKNAEDARANLGVSISDFVKMVYPPGSIYMSTASQLPEVLSNIGTWKQIQGRFLVGAGTITDDNGLTKTFTVGSSGGEIAHKLTATESGVPVHTHGNNITVSDSGHHHPLADSDAIWHSTFKNKLTSGTTTPGYGVAKSVVYNTKTAYANIKKTGGVSDATPAAAVTAHNILPPYLSVNIWYRES